MTEVRHAFEGEPPEGPHFALYTDRSGLAIAVPVGARLDLVLDPTRPDGITPQFIAKLTRRQIIFRCACMRPECTRTLTYSLRVSGWHPESKLFGEDNRGP